MEINLVSQRLSNLFDAHVSITIHNYPDEEQEYEVRVVKNETESFYISQNLNDAIFQTVIKLVTGEVVDGGRLEKVKDIVPDEEIKDEVDLSYDVTNSEIIGRVSYSREHGKLEVLLLNGNKYQYHGVPEKKYHQFISATSKGRYYNFDIKGNFPCERIE